MRLELIVAKVRIHWTISVPVVLLLIFGAGVTCAAPIQVTTKLKGTNQLEITFGPVCPDRELVYEVIARTNTPEGRWFDMFACRGSSNQMVSGVVNLSEKGLTAKSVSQLVFAAGCGDYDGNRISDLYDELVFRGNPYLDSYRVDPYGQPMGDGWPNYEKYQNDLPPYQYCRPPDPNGGQVEFFEDKNSPNTNKTNRAKAIIRWTQDGPAEYFTIYRADCSMQIITNPPPARIPGVRRPYAAQMVHGPFHPVARISYRPGVREYEYIETNVDGFLQPEYQLQARYALPPPPAHLDKVNSKMIAKTVLSVSAIETTNGFELTVRRPIPSARYLLLVRDKNDRQWRGSGYFESGTNRSPVHLRVDRSGMMAEGQGPLALPPAKFLPAVVDPEFVAGWGEDSDGDGLPDSYEVLVTKTAPDDADTGAIGIIDGFKDLSGDGWNTLTKFHLRANPFAAVTAPATAELKRPTTKEMAEALMPKTMFPFVPTVQIRTAGAEEFRPVLNLQEVYQLSFKRIMKDPHSVDVHLDFDLRISWAVPECMPPERAGEH